MTTTATTLATPMSEPPEKPVPKSLAKAFDALCVDDESGSTLESPTGVEAFEDHSSSSSCFTLNPRLQLGLSDALVNRVSFYGIIHDINKEAASMAQADSSSSKEGVAVVDEEEWLLQLIHSQHEQNESQRACPPTFLKAMGEEEYDFGFSKSKTQLWKPSRSWWEAKSGKNPWIEPASHNKRWRYLWPLIHYHKFLAKCIKKLKRNNVDVKVAETPVAVFLREEVCAVSDHLAVVSLFGSEQWMNCLQHFQGWTDTSHEAEAELRRQISGLELRTLEEPTDVDSPLLRSQIEEHFLRAMQQARETAVEPPVSESTRKPPGIPRPPTTPSSVPKQVAGVRRKHAPSQQRQPHPPTQHPHYGPHGWYWDQSQFDNSSVHSAISMDSYNYSHEYNMQQQYMIQQQYYYDGSYHPEYGWVDPNLYAMYPVPPTPEKDDSSSSPAQSPYWAHLDQATISMGLATPGKSPSTPIRSMAATPDKDSYAAKAQPPLLRHPYYPYPGFPSPATQFLMSPQHYRSPITPKKLDRESPSTVDTTTTETESLAEPPASMTNNG